MELLKDKHPDLDDSEITVKFCRRVKGLITAMNSRTPFNSLTPYNDMWQMRIFKRIHAILLYNSN